MARRLHGRKAQISPSGDRGQRGLLGRGKGINQRQREKHPKQRQDCFLKAWRHETRNMYLFQQCWSKGFMGEWHHDTQEPTLPDGSDGFQTHSSLHFLNKPLQSLSFSELPHMKGRLERGKRSLLR